MEKDFEIMYVKGKEDSLNKILIELKEGNKIQDIIKKYKNVTYKELGYIAFDDEEIN
jgi:hypothetical protein